MTNHAELSKELALALGYHPQSVKIEHGLCLVYGYWNGMGPRWRIFSYDGASVCLPLIDWLMREHDGWTFPMMWSTGTRLRITVGWNKRTSIDADTLAKAVARAVIAVKGQS